MKKTLKVRVETLPLNKGNPHSHIEVTCKNWRGKHVNTPLRYCILANSMVHYETVESYLEASELFAYNNKMKFKIEQV